MLAPCPYLVKRANAMLWNYWENFHVLTSLIRTQYIVVQQFTTVSLTGLPVLRTLYEPMSMHKRTNSQNCEFCVFIKVVAFK